MKPSWTQEDYDGGGPDSRRTHIDGPPLCRCGKPAKSYHPRCEDCWLEATRGTMTSSYDRRPACLRFGQEVMSQ